MNALRLVFLLCISISGCRKEAIKFEEKTSRVNGKGGIPLKSRSSDIISGVLIEYDHRSNGANGNRFQNAYVRFTGTDVQISANEVIQDKDEWRFFGPGKMEKGRVTTSFERGTTITLTFSLSQIGKTEISGPSKIEISKKSQE